MPPVGFEPTISAGERPQTYALGRAATGIGNFNLLLQVISQLLCVYEYVKVWMLGFECFRILQLLYKQQKWF